MVKIAKNIVATLKVTDRKTSNDISILEYEDAHMVMSVRGVSCFFKTFHSLYGKAVYQVIHVTEEESVFGVVKNTIKDKDWYLVWSPGSRQPSQQIFTSAKQARYVAYRMSEHNKGQIFYWAKLEGHAQWGKIPNE